MAMVWSEAVNPSPAHASAPIMELQAGWLQVYNSCSDIGVFQFW